MADLTEFYPAPAQATPNGAGRPAAPGAITPARAGGAAMVGAPAVWVLAIVGLSLVLLHRAG